MEVRVDQKQMAWLCGRKVVWTKGARERYPEDAGFENLDDVSQWALERAS